MTKPKSSAKSSAKTPTKAPTQAHGYYDPPRTTPTPIIALTANVMSHQTADYLAAGMNDYVAKPIDLTSLFNVMDKALNSDSDAEADHPVAIQA